MSCHLDTPAGDDGPTCVGQHILFMCKVRCWRWLFGNKIPIFLGPQTETPSFVVLHPWWSFGIHSPENK